MQQGQEGELPHQGRAAVQAQGRRHPLPGLAPGAGQPPGAAGPGKASAGAADGRAAAGGPGPRLLPPAHHGAHRDPRGQGQEESVRGDCAEFIENNYMKFYQ